MMAAGEITGFEWWKVEGARAGASGPPFGGDDPAYQFVCKVQLDGSNPTTIPVAALSGRIRRVVAAIVSLEGSAAPGLDPTLVSAVANGESLDIYAWKPTGAGDGTLVASTNNSRQVNVLGLGAKR